ncbi:hypothetical protein EVAR_31971_1 [Eumeta japonica]|uniref:Endonuclease/exonuclease/phosphatase domain-containing protein n=1 Tax=Eumeta variegata TaxID=151549 RepID=A0A4C1VUV6_EUMVA|nr:hypothetical protein EVAR_31971_1 [Eumeta japonica]
MYESRSGFTVSVGDAVGLNHTPEIKLYSVHALRAVNVETRRRLCKDLDTRKEPATNETINHTARRCSLTIKSRQKSCWAHGSFHSRTKHHYTLFFGRDWNAKYLYWGSRLTNTRGIELKKSLDKNNLNTISTADPTKWPSNPNRLLDSDSHQQELLTTHYGEHAKISINHDTTTTNQHYEHRMGKGTDPNKVKQKFYASSKPSFHAKQRCTQPSLQSRLPAIPSSETSNAQGALDFASWLARMYQPITLMTLITIPILARLDFESGFALYSKPDPAPFGVVLDSYSVLTQILIKSQSRS